MSAAVHVNVGQGTRVDVLADGRVRMSGDGWSVTVEPGSASQAQRLATAFDDARGLLADARSRRLATLDAIEAIA